MTERFRLRIEFWLDLNKDSEADLAEDIAMLKEARMFAPTLRDGLRLVGDLRQGRLDVLRRLFPWVVDRIYSDVEARLLSEGRVGVGRGDLALSTPESEPEPLLVSGNLKALAGSNKPLPGPEEDDALADLLEVKDVSSKNGSVATQNLINSMLRSRAIKSDKAARPNRTMKKKQQPLEDLIEITEGK